MTDPFREQVMGLPEQFEYAPSPQGDPLPPEGRLLIGGLGGSALAGEFLALGQHQMRDVLVVRDEFLPDRIQPNDVLLAISYSGNTSETLALWQQAEERKLPRAAVASGGELLRKAQAAGVSHAAVPAGLAPRSALGYLLRAAWSLTGVPQEPDWSAVAGHLRSVRETWPTTGNDGACPAQELAMKLDSALPVFLAPEPIFVTVARRWMADLAENAKVPSVCWNLPEAAHNAVMTVAREAPDKTPMTLFTLGSPTRNPSRIRWEATLAVIQSHGTTPVAVDEPHDDPWMRALGLAYVGDWVSVFLAEKLGVDVSQLSLMDDLKGRLAGKDNR